MNEYIIWFVLSGICWVLLWIGYAVRNELWEIIKLFIPNVKQNQFFWGYITGIIVMAIIQYLWR